MRSLWLSGHLLQLLPQSPLSEVSNQRSREMASRPRAGTSSGELFSPGLQRAACIGATDLAEQESSSPTPVRSKLSDITQLGAEIGCLSILHTWGRTLQPHPHIHCVVPGGGLSPDHARWISSRPHFFLPVKVLSRVFRGKFVAGLKRAFRRNKLAFHGACLPLSNEKMFAQFLRTLFRQDWVVYSKPPFGGPKHVLQYLARYTHRVAISNHRIVNLTDAHVAFRWKDYAHRNRRRVMTLTHQEFLRRFLQHVLPKGFPRIRYFGFLANRRRGQLLPLCCTLLGQSLPAPDPTAAPSGEPPTWQCPLCQGPMQVIERWTALQLPSELCSQVNVLDSS